MTQTLNVAVRRFGPFESAIRRQFEDFLAAGGADAEMVTHVHDLNPLHDLTIGKRALGSGDIDIAFLCTDWLAEAQQAGLLEDLAPWQTRAPIADFPDGWAPSLLSLQSFDGGFWGMPYHDGPECLIYRKDLLERAALPVPTTWEAFHQTARALHGYEPGLAGTALAQFPDGHNGFYDFCIHIWSRGGEPFTPDGRPDFTSPAAHAALDFLRVLAADGDAVAPHARQTDSVQSGMMFARGEVAMMANWFGFAAYADTAADSVVRGLVDVAPLPAGPGGASVSLNVFWVLAIGSGSANKALAWDFLRHCARPDMDLMTTTEGAIGVRRSTWADAGVNAAIPYYHRLEWLHDHARQMPVTPRLAAISHVVDAMLERAMTGDEPTATLLARAQAAAEAAL